MPLSVIDYVPRGNGLTVSFSNGEVVDLTYKYDPSTRRLNVSGGLSGEQRNAINALVTGNAAAELAVIDQRYARPPFALNRSQFSLSGSATTNLSIPFDNIIQVALLRIEYNGQHSVTGTIDPGNVSSTPGNQADGSPITSTLNDLSPGTTNKELPALDFGSPVTIRTSRLFWSNAALLATSFTVQTSNDGVTWTDTAHSQANSLGLTNLKTSFGLPHSSQDMFVYSVL